MPTSPQPISPQLAQEAVKLAQRSRLGDQNATGMIEEIAKHAKAGHSPAMASHPIILRWLDEHPLPGAEGVSEQTAELLSRLAECFVPPWVGVVAVFSDMATMGSEEAVVEGACCLLTEGPDVCPDLIASFLSAWPPACREHFVHGVTFAGDSEGIRSLKAQDPVQAGALCAGHCLGTARRWQAVRRGAPLTFLSADVGWELD